MTYNSTPSHSAKLTPRQRTFVRTALATGATLMMLISAQLFASGAAGSTDSTTSTNQSVIITPTAQAATTTVNTTIDDSSQIALTSNQSGTIYNTQAQPVPSTHSSR